MTERLPSSASDDASRILQAARQQLFSQGYRAFTMDGLAHELGMSKKTLYAHFSGKDEILTAVLNDFGGSVRKDLESAITHAEGAFVQKLSALITVGGSHLSRVSPVFLRELQRFAPQHYARIEELRREHIPYVFGRMIRDGIASGAVAPDVDPVFATEFWTSAIQGLMQPDALERTGLNPRQTLDQAVHLFFRGLLSPADRKDYEHYRRDRRFS